MAHIRAKVGSKRKKSSVRKLSALNILKMDSLQMLETMEERSQAPKSGDSVRKEVLQRAFDLFDRDSNGTMELKEMIHLLSSLGRRMSGRQIKIIMTEMSSIHASKGVSKMNLSNQFAKVVPLDSTSAKPSSKYKAFDTSSSNATANIDEKGFSINEFSDMLEGFSRKVDAVESGDAEEDDAVSIHSIMTAYVFQHDATWRIMWDIFVLVCLGSCERGIRDRLTHLRCQ